MSISEMNLKEKSLLFAKLAADAYGDKADVIKLAKKHGFTKTKFYDIGGAQAYRFENKTDVVVACRGTQPTEFNDLKADLKAFPVKSETVSRVHRGFKNEVDELWPMVCEDIGRTVNVGKKLWICGHSLGAAMATIAAGRMQSKVLALITFGSPRVGNKEYVNSLTVKHYRVQNNCDDVTKVPFMLMGFVHHGTHMYMNYYGAFRNLTPWQQIKDMVRSRLKARAKGQKFLGAYDHMMDNYIAKLGKLGEE